MDADKTDSERAEKAATVLIIDDDPRIRAALRSLLEHDGHNVHEATGGLHGLETAEAIRPDVVLLDLAMPGINGVETCRRLKASPSTATVPVIMVTGSAEREDRIAGIDAGATDFLTKPVDSQDVRLRVRNAAHGKHLFDTVSMQYQQLRELEALRDNLTHMVVHDLRAPIATIMVALHLIRDHGDRLSHEKVCETIARACKSGKDVTELITSVLDVSRLESNSMPLRLTEGDVATVLTGCVQSMGIADRTQRIVCDLPDAPLRCKFDQHLIRRVVNNLLHNAIKHTPPNGIITIAGSRRNGTVRTVVSDTGPGIPKSYHARIFEKFGQVEEQQGHTIPSTGLGLTFCRLAVEAHGGHIGVESEPGAGSAFWFELQCDPVPGN